jgi:hypothetical protein
MFLQLIRCTKKLQKEMGLAKSVLEAAEPSLTRLGPWHANLIYIDRRKCVLFTNDKTLFNFIAPDVSRAQIRNLAELFRGWLSCVLADEGFPQEIIESVLAEHADIVYGNTNSKSVLGSMNDIAYQYQFSILSEGGVHSPAVPAIIRQLNRMPLSAIGYGYAIEKLRALLHN